RSAGSAGRRAVLRARAWSPTRGLPLARGRHRTLATSRAPLKAAYVAVRSPLHRLRGPPAPARPALGTHLAATTAPIAAQARRSTQRQYVGHPPEKMPNRALHARCRDAGHNWPATRLAAATHFRPRR